MDSTHPSKGRVELLTCKKQHNTTQGKIFCEGTEHADQLMSLPTLHFSPGPPGLRINPCLLASRMECASDPCLSLRLISRLFLALTK